MEDGRIIERGTHASLMAARGGYFEMVKRQMEDAALVGVRETRDGSNFLTFSTPSASEI